MPSDPVMDPSPTVVVVGLTLRPLRAQDEGAVRAADAELAVEGFDLLMGQGATPFGEVRAAFAREARGEVPEGWVPASFLVAVDQDGEVVGRVSVRWELNDAVRPAFRRRGHAARILRGALSLLAERGVASALVTCGESNAGSAGAIRACGGVLRDRLTHGADGSPPAEPTLRFNVPTTTAAAPTRAG